MKKFCWVLALGFISLANVFGDALDNWTKVATSPYGGITQIICSNSTFVALSAQTNEGYGRIYTNGISVSPDGTHWTHYPFAEYPSGISYYNGTYVVSCWNPYDDADDGSLLAVTNPASFPYTRSAYPYPPVGGGEYGLTFGYGTYYIGGVFPTNLPLFVAVSFDYEGGDIGTIMTSTNGSNWVTQTTSTTNFFPGGVAFGYGEFVSLWNPYTAIGNTRVVWSQNGTNWNVVPTNYTASLPALGGISFVKSLFYAAPIVSSGYPTNGWSSDGPASWTKVSIPYPSLYASDVYFNGIYLSVHPGYPLATSYDGTNWTTRNTGITNALTCAAYGDNCVVMCAADGSIFRSGSTIPTLAPEGTFTNGGFQLTVTNAFNSACEIQASADLVHWTNIASCSNVQGSTQIVDTNASQFSQRFYRTVVQ